MVSALLLFLPCSSVVCRYVGTLPCRPPPSPAPLPFFPLFILLFFVTAYTRMYARVCVSNGSPGLCTLSLLFEGANVFSFGAFLFAFFVCFFRRSSLSRITIGRTDTPQRVASGARRSRSAVWGGQAAPPPSTLPMPSPLWWRPGQAPTTPGGQRDLRQ